MKMKKIVDLRKIKKGSLIYDKTDRYGIIYKVKRNEIVHLVEIEIIHTSQETPGFKVGDCHQIIGIANKPLKTKFLLMTKGEAFFEVL
jgi:hypothetical protein